MNAGTKTRRLTAALALLIVACNGPRSGPRATPTSPALSPGTTASSPASPAVTHSAGPKSPGPSATALGALPNFAHVVVVVMENKEYGSIIGNPDAPYINGLATAGALATQYYAVSHPSLPNYLALTGGSTFGISSDCKPSPGCSVSGPGIVDELEAAGKSWKGYMEDLPSACATSKGGQYAVKHNPFFYYNKVVANWCGNVMPAGQLQADLAAGQLPAFAWLTPNLCNDMHDCSVKTGDGYLAGVLPKVLDALGSNGVLFLTWDEGESSLGGGLPHTAGGQVTMIAAGPAAKRGYRSSIAANHYSLLRTIQDAWGLAPLNDSVGASPMTDLFTG